MRFNGLLHLVAFPGKAHGRPPASGFVALTKIPDSCALSKFSEPVSAHTYPCQRPHVGIPTTLTIRRVWPRPVLGLMMGIRSLSNSSAPRSALVSTPIPSSLLPRTLRCAGEVSSSVSITLLVGFAGSCSVGLGDGSVAVAIGEFSVTVVKLSEGEGTSGVGSDEQPIIRAGPAQVKTMLSFTETSPKLKPRWDLHF